MPEKLQFCEVATIKQQSLCGVGGDGCSQYKPEAPHALALNESQLPATP